MFERIIGIDWSGAKKSHASNRGLAVAQSENGAQSIVQWHQRSRSRAELTEWISKQLSPEKPVTLVGLDFAFGFPAGAMKSVFGVQTWREMAERVRDLLSRHETAISVAMELNANPAFRGNGPFRTDADRNNYRFYLDHGVPYFRLVESYVPQAISQWYLGSGATVGFSTITGIAALGELLARRDRGECSFRVFPFEPIEDQAHVLAEVYPAVWPRPQEGWVGEHERDALRTVIGLSRADTSLLRLPSALAAHASDAAIRVREEGWMAGVA